MAITPLMPVYPRCDVRPVRGEGVYLYGENGEKYLDFATQLHHPHLETTALALIVVAITITITGLRPLRRGGGRRGERRGKDGGGD